MLSVSRQDESIFLGSASGTEASQAWRDAVAHDPLQALRAAKGNFAIAERDDRGRVFMAVDRFAVQTLCYRQVADQLHFAARADALAGSDPDIDLQAIYDYLFFHVIPSPRTIFKDVHRLPPGHYAIFEGGKLRVASYWKPAFTADRRAPFAVLRDEFQSLLRQAVARQLDDGKPACFLSGGTDSSTIAGMIGAIANRPAATYSIGFEAAGYDEMAYARIAARHFGTEHHEYYVTPTDLVAGIAKVASHYDQPFGNSSALPAYYCQAMAKADGVTRLLAGDGGDELFGGNARYAKQRVFDAYGELPAGLRRHLVEPLLLADAGPARLSLLRKAASYVEQARLSMPDRLGMYNLLLRLGPSNVLTPRFLEAVDGESPARQQRAVWAQSGARNAIDATLAFDWRYTLAESDLPKVCGTARLAGIEVGFPLLDTDLLEFSMRLPANYKVRGLRLRWFFKRALSDFLPPAIIRKTKHGFGLPFGVWLLKHAPLRRLAAASLESVAERGVVRQDFVHSLLDARVVEHPGYYGEMVWILMMLEQWLQRHAPRFAVPS